MRLLSKDIPNDHKGPFKTPDGETHDKVEVEKALVTCDIEAANLPSFTVRYLIQPSTCAPQIQAALTLLEHFTNPMKT